MFRAPNPLRCVRGAVAIGAINNHGVAALFNNSLGPHVIILWSVSHDQSLPMYGFPLKGRLTNQGVGTINPVVTDEGAPVGLLDSDDLAVLPAPDCVPVLGFGSLGFPGQTYPLALLRPGWSFVLSPGTSGNSFTFAFYWEWMFAEELWRPSAGDSEDLP